MCRLITILVTVVALAGCRAPYLSDYANMLTVPDDLPQTGISTEDLTVWFEDRGYIPGAQVLQAEAELRRRPRDPLVYAQPGDREWWLTAHRTVQHGCVTRHTIYYRLDPQGRLDRAIRAHRNTC